MNSSTVESGVKTRFSSPSNQVTKVNCPANEKVQAGATFKCDVTWSNGANGKVTVTQAGAGKYMYSLVPGSVQVPGATLDKTLEKQLAKKGAPNATVSCPQNVVVKTGTTVSCAVSGAGGAASGAVTFAFSSATGTIDPSSVNTG